MPSDCCYHKNSSRNCTVKVTKSGHCEPPRCPRRKSPTSLIDSQVVKTTPSVMHKCQAVIVGPQDHEIELIVAILEIVNTPPRRHIPVGSQGSCRGRAGNTSTDAGTREHTDAQKHRHTDTPPRETQPPPLVPRGPAPGNAARSRPYTSRSITSRTMRASAITVEKTTHCAARVILLVAVGDHSTLPASHSPSPVQYKSIKTARGQILCDGVVVLV